MKRRLLTMTLMAFLLGVAGCENADTAKTTESVTDAASEEATSEAVAEDVSEQEEASTQETAKEEKDSNADEELVKVTFTGKNDDVYNDLGNMIVYVYYTRPVVEIAGNEAASTAINQELEDDEAAFDMNCETLAAEAKQMLADEMTEDVSPYANEVRFSEKRIDDKVVCFERYNYTHNGGAHGNTFYFGWNFDVETGKRLTISDIAEDEEAFMANVKDYVLALCESDAYNSRLFPEYQDYIDYVLQDDLWYFDQEGITFIANIYEIAAYAEGTIRFTVPYNELEGLKPEYAYDGGFQKSYALGETAQIDLNGDGTADEITFDAEETSDYMYVAKLTINGADYSNVLEDNNFYFAYPYEKFVVMDIDESDEYLEIAIQDYGMSDDPATAFLRYDGSQVLYLGEVYDRVSDLYITSNGDGILHARERMHIFETVNRKVKYNIVDGKLTQCMDELYPIAYVDASREKGLLQDLYVFTDMSTSSDVVKLDKETEVIVLATDNAEWVQVQYVEDGKIYYVHVVNHYLIDMNGLEVDSREVFTPIIQAG